MTTNMKNIKTILLLGFFMTSIPMVGIKHEIPEKVVNAVDNFSEALKITSERLSGISKDLSDKNMINYAITKSGYAGAGVASIGLGLWCAKEAIKDFRTVLFSKEGIKEALGKPTAIDPDSSEEDAKKAVEEKNKFQLRKQWLLLNPVLAALFTGIGIWAINNNPTMPTPTTPSVAPTPAIPLAPSLPAPEIISNNVSSSSELSSWI